MFPQLIESLPAPSFQPTTLLAWTSPSANQNSYDALLSQLDLYPPICELLAIQPPAWLQGRSFLPVLRGEAQEINDAIFAVVNYHVSYEPKRAVRTNRWKYIRHFGDYMHPVLPTCHDGSTRTCWVDHGCVAQNVAPKQLYALIFDPNERHNLAAKPVHQDVLHTMQARWKDWMVTTNEPSLHRPVKAPPGAQTLPPKNI
ncbi:MAG: sulfatase/phosphatase domain-containing protein [Acidobacteriaceae bacterium]